MLDLLREFSRVYSCGRKCHFIQLAAHKRMSSYFVDSRLATHTFYDLKEQNNFHFFVCVRVLVFSPTLAFYCHFMHVCLRR